MFPKCRKVNVGAVVVHSISRLQDQRKRMHALQKFNISEWSSLPSELNEVLVSRIDQQLKKLYQLDRMDTSGCA